MHGSGWAEKEGRTSRIDELAEAMLATFGARAPSMVARQIAGASAPARTSWEAILARIEVIRASGG